MTSYPFCCPLFTAASPNHLRNNTWHLLPCSSVFTSSEDPSSVCSPVHSALDVHLKPDTFGFSVSPDRPLQGHSYLLGNSLSPWLTVCLKISECLIEWRKKMISRILLELEATFFIFWLLVKDPLELWKKVSMPLWLPPASLLAFHSALLGTA